MFITAKWLKQFLKAKNTHKKNKIWPAKSPVLNPIENLWKILGDKVIDKKPSTFTELQRSVVIS